MRCLGRDGLRAGTRDAGAERVAGHMKEHDVTGFTAAVAPAPA
jgi:hypothetical protein